MFCGIASSGIALIWWVGLVLGVDGRRVEFLDVIARWPVIIFVLERARVVLHLSQGYTADLSLACHRKLNNIPMIGLLLPLWSEEHPLDVPLISIVNFDSLKLLLLRLALHEELHISLQVVPINVLLVADYRWFNAVHLHATSWPVWLSPSNGTTMSVVGLLTELADLVHPRLAFLISRAIIFVRVQKCRVDNRIHELDNAHLGRVILLALSLRIIVVACTAIWIELLVDGVLGLEPLPRSQAVPFNLILRLTFLHKIADRIIDAQIVERFYRGDVARIMPLMTENDVFLFSQLSHVINLLVALDFWDAWAQLG